MRALRAQPWIHSAGVDCAFILFPGLIATAAVQNLLGGETTLARSRKPEIMADAAHYVLTRPSGEFTGRFCIDEDVLRAAGVQDLDQYSCTPGAELLPDFFL